jgi:hypothetical protein
MDKDMIEAFAHDGTDGGNMKRNAGRPLWSEHGIDGPAGVPGRGDDDRHDDRIHEATLCTMRVRVCLFASELPEVTLCGVLENSPLWSGLLPQSYAALAPYLVIATDEDEEDEWASSSSLKNGHHRHL